GSAGNAGNCGNCGNSGAETPLSPSTFIDSILRDNEPGAAPGNAPSQEKCLSVACLDKNELNEHLDSIDSNLDNLQALLSTHGFSMDSALLDIQDLLSSQEQQKPAEAEAGAGDAGNSH
ncbi:HSF1 protein, partial [Ptilonorhynchus violaceus]|nr:HSF1 protein [Ptilonorhynchus violaceus]